MTTSEEVALRALKFWLRTVFAEVPFLLTVKAFIFAACLYGIDVHGVRVFPANPFHRSFLYETKELFVGSRLPKVSLECI